MSDVPLREFIERILSEREKALSLTASALERRLNELNNLRSEVMQDRNLFLSKPVYDQMHADLMRRIDLIENRLSRVVGVGIALIAVSGLLGFIMGKIFK